MTKFPLRLRGGQPGCSSRRLISSNLRHGAFSSRTALTGRIALSIRKYLRRAGLPKTALPVQNDGSSLPEALQVLGREDTGGVDIIAVSPSSQG